jgi:hypothetical protein
VDINFLGGSYKGRSIAADGQETVNWYPEVSEEPTGNNDVKLILIPTPGLILFTNLES